MVGQGRRENSQDHRNRTPVARREDEPKECVLSPISARTTIPAETRNASRDFSPRSAVSIPFPRDPVHWARRRRQSPAESAGGRDLVQVERGRHAFEGQANSWPFDRNLTTSSCSTVIHFVLSSMTIGGAARPTVAPRCRAYPPRSLCGGGQAGCGERQQARVGMSRFM